LRELDRAVVERRAVRVVRNRRDPRQIERFRDQRAQGLDVFVWRNRTNAARARRETQHVIALRRRKRKSAGIDRIQQRAGAARERRISSGNVVTDAGVRRANKTDQGLLSAVTMPLDGVGDKGTEMRGLGRRHDLKLQVPPGAPAANV
jgi:hypothetical protein